jgi:hypothetical protein
VRNTAVAGIVVGAVAAMGLAAAQLWRDDRSGVRIAPSMSPPADSSPFTSIVTSEPIPSPESAVPAASAPPADLPSEGLLMDRLRAIKGTDAARAVALAREGSRRFPDSPDDPERASILIHALASLGRASEARAEAERMVNQAPDSPWVTEIETFTGAHRHRNLRLIADGALEYY